MSRIVIMEVAMKEELPELYDIYFGGKVLFHYEEEIPFLVVGTTSNIVADRALQRSTSTVLSSIYEQDFLNCSFGGRPNRGAHNVLATLNETISGKKVSWVLEADLKNFFGTLDHDWVIKFVQHRVGDPRIISLIKRWLKAGVMEGNEVQISETGTPQGGSISVLLSNIYLHYVLDLWFEKAIKL
uniref:reverse transcriptase domain-containing protein n=1 Tax=Neobacillus niacini TaxID=86668 RepID=UPI0005EE1BA9